MVEMLTVVGIIAVLVAVSIPIVNSSLEKAQKATDAANERAAKGAMLTESLLAENPGTDYLYYDNAAGQWKDTAPTPYGKCDDHKDCYLIGKVLEFGVVRIVWADGPNEADERATLCSGESVMADTGSTSQTPALSAPATQGDFMVQAQDLATDVSINNNVLTIRNGATVVIRNKPDIATTAQRIEVADGTATTNITLDGVNIDTSEGAAFKIANDSKGDVTITLNGTNILKSSNEEGYAGLEKIGVGNSDGTEIGMLTIKGRGSLTATGSHGAAGIGGSNVTNDGTHASASNITIRGGIVTATGSGGGAGIGGGYCGAGKYIIISGGRVEAKGGSNGGAGIGGGGGPMHPSTDGSDITISGGIVTATSSGGGAGIGGGESGYGNDITISNSTVTVTATGDGEDIGNGKDYLSSAPRADITVNGNQHTPKKDGTTTYITKDIPTPKV